MKKEYTAIYSSEIRSPSKSRKKATVRAIRDQDGMEITAGDVVLLNDDPDVQGKEFALVQGLKEGDQGLEAKCVLMKQFNDAEALTPKHVIPNTNKNRYSKDQELVMMNSIVDILVEELHLPVKCHSFAAFEALSREDKKRENVYFCRYVFDEDANKTSVELDWEDVTKEMTLFIDILYELITDKPRKRRAAVKASRQTSRHARDDDDDGSDEDHEEEDDEDIEEDDDYDSPVEEAKKARTPKSTKTRTTKKAQATTPRKRALDDMDLPQPDHNTTPMTTPKKKRKTENGHGLATPKR